MTDSSVAGLDRLINTCRILFTQGKDVRTPKEGKAWQGRADQVEQEARAWITAWSPDEAVRLETLGPYHQVVLPMGHPSWTPPPSVLDVIASSTSSVLCEENNPVSYHRALLVRLEEIVRDWRIESPEKPIGRFQYWADAVRAYSEHVKSTREMTGQAPTEAEDFAWGADHSLKRVKVRALRKNSPDRTDKDRRSTNPAEK